MAFLREKDYFKQIAQPHLEQILQQARSISGDAEIRQVAEVTSIARAKEKLSSRYKVNKIFTDLQTFDIAANYKWGDRVDFTASTYSASTSYTSGQIVLYNTGTASAPINKIYLRNAVTLSYVVGTLPTNTTYFSYVGDESIYYVTPPEEWDEDVTYPASTGKVTYKHEYYIRTANTAGYEITGLPKDGSNLSIYDQWADVSYLTANVPQANTYGNNTTPQNSQYWTKILDFTPYLITGVWPSDSTKWTKGDNRSLTMVKCIIDLSLYLIHGIVNPNQLPQLRVDRYKEAENWLNECAAGAITPDLPTYTEDYQKGFAIRFGSNPPTSHSY